jgi:hypothetical protein
VTDLVPTEEIEQLVGAQRLPMAHVGRAVSAKETVYILHSQRCKDAGGDLRTCPFSLALDEGIDLRRWAEFMDRPVVLGVSPAGGSLVPLYSLPHDLAARG